MTDPRVLNISKNITVRRSQAKRWIEQCACVWVEEGVSIRDLTLSERVAARSQQAAIREPLPVAELPGIQYQPAANAQAATRAGYMLIQQANAFCGAQ